MPPANIAHQRVLISRAGPVAGFVTAWPELHPVATSSGSASAAERRHLPAWMTPGYTSSVGYPRRSGAIHAAGEPAERHPRRPVRWGPVATCYIAGAVPAEYEPEDASTVRMPIGADPRADPSVRAHVAAGWQIGDQWRDVGDDRFKVVYLYPPALMRPGGRLPDAAQRDGHGLAADA